MKGGTRLGDLSVNRRIILKWILMRECRTDSTDSFEYGNERSGSIKTGEFLDQLSDY